MSNPSPTKELWKHYQQAFDYFNQFLFEGQLEPCILNFSSKGRSPGYFGRGRWKKDNKTYAHEISLNPDLLKQPVGEVMSTLVRLMVQLWQHQHGCPGKPGYYNQEWAEKMKEIGLIPSDTGEPGGKETGYKMRPYIEESGKFAAALKKIPNDYFPWKGETQNHLGAKPSRIKYICPVCGTNFYGSPGILAICQTAKCDVLFEALDH